MIVLLLYKSDVISINNISTPSEEDDDTSTSLLSAFFNFFLSNPYRVMMVIQWCYYVTCLCIFHLLEFFTSSIYNPQVLSSDSFLVNHSLSYTLAAIVSLVEFLLRLVLLPSILTTTINTYMFGIGCCMVVVSQITRSLAMITCGESFNHLIQRTKKDNHALITHGIYSIFRHPSYVGFYYWSIGMQCILGNVLSCVACIVASYLFFQRRIPYEERCLMELFPKTNGNYKEYAKSTYIGIIPFIHSSIVELDDDDSDDDEDSEDDSIRDGNANTVETNNNGDPKFKKDQ